MKIVRAEVADAAQILRIQKSAYQSEAELYNNFEILPLKETLPEIEAQFQTCTFLKAVSENKIVGTVRAYEKHGTCYIGRLAVTPQRQNQGIGTALMKNIEKLFNPERYELFTGAKSEKNIRLYQKLGYAICKKSDYAGGMIEIYFMEKVIKPA